MARDRVRIGGTNHELGPSRQIVWLVGDDAALRAHHRGARHGLHVNHRRCREITVLECVRDLANMLPNLCNPGRIVGVAEQLDSAALLERIELVRRGVLIHAHGLFAAPLHRRIGGVFRRWRSGAR